MKKLLVLSAVLQKSTNLTIILVIGLNTKSVTHKQPLKDRKGSRVHKKYQLMNQRCHMQLFIYVSLLGYQC